MQIEQYRTIFGFYTSNKVACKAIDYVYWVVITVAFIFAFHALHQILSTWNFFLIAIAALAVVGLPYCVKIILFGRDEFDHKAALLCVFLSLLPTIFDFAGFYSETAINDELKKGKLMLVENINTLEKNYKLSIEQQKEKITKEIDTKIKSNNTNLSSFELEANKKLNEARQLVLDEKQGVKSDYTTGKVGEGPKAKELVSNVRRTESSLSLELDAQKSSIKLDNETLTKTKEEKFQSINENLQIFENEILNLKNSLTDTTNFKDVEKEMLKINSFFSSHFSKIGVDYKAITPKNTDNILTLAFNALFRLDITAIICMLMALLMEVGDIVITYVIRLKKKIVTPKIHKQNDEFKPHLYKKTYGGY